MKYDKWQNLKDKLGEDKEAGCGHLEGPLRAFQSPIVGMMLMTKEKSYRNIQGKLRES